MTIGTKAQMKKGDKWLRVMGNISRVVIGRFNWSSSTDSRSTYRELNTERERERDHIFTDIIFNHSLTGQQISNYSNLSSQIAMDCRNVSGVRVYVCTA